MRDRFGDAVPEGSLGECVGSVSSFAIDQMASSYSQVAAVLAGFAFTALVVVLTRGIGGRMAVQAAPLLLSSMFSLSLTAVGYAVLAGEQTSGVRAAQAAVAMALVFTSAGMAVVGSIARLVNAAGAHWGPGARFPDSLRAIGAVAVAPILMLSLAGSTADLREIDTSTTDLQWLGRALAAALLVVVGTAAALRKSRPVGSLTQIAASYLPAVTTGVALVGTVAVFGAFGSTCPHDKLPVWTTWVVLSLGAVVLLFSALALLHEVGEETGDTNEAASAWSSR